MWIWAVAITLLVVATIGVAYAKRRNPTWRPLLPGFVGTGVGAAVCLVVYGWGFDVSTCNGRGDVACMLNANQGVLTVVALLLTVAGLWVAALNRVADQRENAVDAARRRQRVIASALEETGHNLIHVALAYDTRGERLQGVPQLSVEEVLRLCDPEFQSSIFPGVLEAARAINRNLEGIRYAERERDGTTLHDRLEGFVNNSLRLLAYAAKTHPHESHEILGRPGYQDFRRLAIHPANAFYVAFRSSECESEAPALRTDEVPVLCWWNDRAPEGVEVFAEGPRFRDMSHPPH